MSEVPVKKIPTRIVGIDYGTVRIGIAISDEQKIIASPLCILPAEKKTERTIVNLLHMLKEHQHQHRYEIEEIVIGLPLMMSGKIGFLADEVQHFVSLLKKMVTIHITTWDERLTSVQAERSLREASLSRKKRVKKVDTVAAVIILQNYLSFKKVD